jgi:arylsulfatase A-like enzyme
MSVYPTLCDLTGIPIPKHVEGESIRALLKDPAAAWDKPALTTHKFKNHAVRDETWRYIRYANGDEELYNHATDPNEWTNVASKPEYADVKKKLAASFPKQDQADLGGRAGAGAEEGENTPTRPRRRQPAK